MLKHGRKGYEDKAKNILKAQQSLREEFKNDKDIIVTSYEAVSNKSHHFINYFRDLFSHSLRTLSTASHLEICSKSRRDGRLESVRGLLTVCGASRIPRTPTGKTSPSRFDTV